MKAFYIFTRLFVIGIIVFSGYSQLKGQDKGTGASFDAGADLVSNYVWRGTKYGVGPQVQPYVEFSVGNLAIGSWGSYGFAEGDGVAAFAESDLYISYGFDFGLSLGITDYYYPGTSYFDYSSPDGSHGIEANLGYEVAGFSVSANYMINEASGAGTAGGDMYFELGYSFESVSLFVGGGNGWHTSDGDFAVCNVGLSVSKEIPITEEYALPVSGALILNPESSQYHVVFAVSF
jgi:hypothetical protein